MWLHIVGIPTDTDKVMATYSYEQREEYKAIIRRVLTMNPSMSAYAMQKQLAEASNPIKLDRVYVGELMKEIRADRIRELDEETKESLYTEMRDLVEYINGQLRAIAQEEKLVYQKTKDGVPVEKPETRIFAQNNRIKALNSIVANVEKLMKLKMDLGLTERRLGTVDVDVRYFDAVAFVEKLRNGDYSTPIESLIAKLPAGALAGGTAS